MRVAMLGPFGLDPKGTMRQRALPLARALVRQGHAVGMWLPPWHTPEAAGRTWEDSGVHGVNVSLWPGRPPWLYAPVTARLVRQALAWRPDVIHCFKPKAYAGGAAWLLWHLRRLALARVRLVVDEDDWEGPGGWNALEPYPRALRAAFAWQERWGLRHTDAVTVASRALESLTWALGVPPERVHYLPNGVAGGRIGDGISLRARLGLGGAPVMLLYTRFFEFDVARAVAAFAEIHRALPAARLLVVGQALFPADGERFHALLHAQGLDDAVCDCGWVAWDALPDYWAAADVALFPFDDTLVNRCKCSVKLLDLLSAGVPVVAEAVGQSAEYIRHGETGWLVPSGQPEALAQAALALLRDRALARHLGAQAAQHVTEHYHWELLAERLCSVYTTA